jgi:hypothetical protein
MLEVYCSYFLENHYLLKFMGTSFSICSITYVIQIVSVTHASIISQIFGSVLHLKQSMEAPSFT